jgi:hypothetical protein
MACIISRVSTIPSITKGSSGEPRRMKVNKQIQQTKLVYSASKL